LVDFYLGRQPILDRQQNVVGYELLFRSSLANFCDTTDDVAATSQVIVNGVLGIGLDRLLGGKPAFINFDQTLLLGDWTTLLPPDKVVIEILESVPPDQEVLTACDRLRQHGYAVALDDCPDDRRTAAFAPFVDILKVDFRQTSPRDQANLVRQYEKLNLRMFAEKVETAAEFQRALQLGYVCFQGFFFAQPTVLETTRIPVSHVNALRLVKQAQKHELDYLIIQELVRHDLSFSYSLLKYVNSAAFRWAGRISSIRQALALLGADEIRKWIWMATLTSIGRNRPHVLMTQVMVRGRFCEAIAGTIGLATGESDPFLLGMFSLLDVILQRPLLGVLDDLNIAGGIRDALLGYTRVDDPLSLALCIVKAYESCDWAGVDVATRLLGVSCDRLSTCYLESLEWVENVMAPDVASSEAARSSIGDNFHRIRETGDAVLHGACVDLSGR
jgi:c-di-GMP-related signal transduction protein